MRALPLPTLHTSRPPLSASGATARRNTPRQGDSSSGSALCRNDGHVSTSDCRRESHCSAGPSFRKAKPEESPSRALPLPTLHTSRLPLSASGATARRTTLRKGDSSSGSALWRNDGLRGKELAVAAASGVDFVVDLVGVEERCAGGYDLRAEGEELAHQRGFVVAGSRLIWLALST